MKNPPLVILTAVAALAAFATLVLLALAVAGVGKSYDFDTMAMIGGLPIWVALIPAAVLVFAGIGALVLWGAQRASK